MNLSEHISNFRKSRQIREFCSGIVEKYGVDNFHGERKVPLGDIVISQYKPTVAVRVGDSVVRFPFLGMPRSFALHDGSGVHRATSDEIRQVEEVLVYVDSCAKHSPGS